MVARHLLALCAVIFQLSAKQSDFYYVVDNGLGTIHQIAPNYGVRGTPYNLNYFYKLLSHQGQGNRVKIQLYYECLCPDCKDFDTRQFKQTVQKLGPHLDIHVYPYGNAKTEEHDGLVKFVCQHGPAECYGNKLHACAIDYLKNVTTAIFYNSCMMDPSQANGGSNDAAADACGRSMGINSEAIKQCAKGDAGTKLLKYYGEESKKVNFPYVPYILINGVVNNGEHFMQDVCKAFKIPPSACNGLI